MTEALLLIAVVNGGLWLLLWTMAELEPPHPHPQPESALREMADADPRRWADQTDDHLGLTA